MCVLVCVRDIVLSCVVAVVVVEGVVCVTADAAADGPFVVVVAVVVYW